MMQMGATHRPRLSGVTMTRASANPFGQRDVAPHQRQTDNRDGDQRDEQRVDASNDVFAGARREHGRVDAEVVEEPVHVGPAEVEEQRRKQGRRCDELTEDPDEPGEARERRSRRRRLSRLV
jgi:hypothetical protein